MRAPRAVEGNKKAEAKTSAHFPVSSRAALRRRGRLAHVTITPGD
jgi:hypothetical protein